MSKPIVNFDALVEYNQCLKALAECQMDRRLRVNVYNNGKQCEIFRGDYYVILEADTLEVSVGKVNDYGEWESLMAQEFIQELNEEYGVNK